ncbi:MAG: hypothetical protein DCC68_16385 [Planctomycetota bacterium]|nr:MAG: hypothetical protein DCC68_16385 [Planctomycetota bacterium]
MTPYETAGGPEIEFALADFLDEARQLIRRIRENLLALGATSAEIGLSRARDDDARALDEAFRAVHSIKSVAGLLGLEGIERLALAVHGAFGAVRTGDVRPTADLVGAARTACERLEAMIESLSSPATEEPRCDDVLGAIAVAMHAAQAQPEAQHAGSCRSPNALPGDDIPPPRPAPSREWPAATTDHFNGLVDEQAPSKYLAIFIDEAEMSIDSMTEVLLAEGGDARATTETLLITSHRIKGSAASIGLHRPAKLAHLMEDILQDLRDRGENLSATLVDAILRCTDALRTYVQQLRGGAPQSEHFGQLAHELLAAHAPASAAQGAEGVPSFGPNGAPRATVTVSLTENQRNEILRLAPRAMPSLAGMVRFEPGLMLSGLKARLLYEKLSQEGQVYYCDPAAERLDELDDLCAFAFAVATSTPEAEIAAKLQMAGVASVMLESAFGQSGSEAVLSATEETPTPADATAREAGSSGDCGDVRKSPQRYAAANAADAANAISRDGSRPVETLRVDIHRLDQLMNLAGQLVINKARFARVGEGMRTAMPTKQTTQAVDNVRSVLEGIAAGSASDEPRRAAAELQSIRSQVRRAAADVEMIQREMQKIAQLRASIADLGDAVHQLDRVADGIQKSVMDTRMVPVGPLFSRFKRVVRDITRANHKQVELVIRGEKTELDKRMIDELGDPLIHMVRNAADHGIESPEVRKAAGKPANGTIFLEAYHRGNSIVIVVGDDGRGMDPEHIRRKAIEKGIVSESDAERLSDAQSLALIWEPGFSTAEKVTEISGRGMGMDIVRSKIEQLNGTVELASRKGEGTTFTIKLPLTLAILPSLLVRVDGDVFAVPLDAVVEIVTIAPHDLRTVHRKATARVRDRIVSVVRLNEIFCWRHGTLRLDADHRQTTLVVLGADGCEIGLVVDRPLGEEDIVIKSMAENYRNVPGIAGASILGDGRVSLILDPNALVEMASRREVAVRCPS